MATLNIPFHQHRSRVTLLALLGLLILAVAAPAARAANVGSFTADLSVSQPNPLAPADGATLAYPDNGVALHWSDVGGATTYQLQIANVVAPATTCTFANDTLVDTSVTGTAYVPSFLDSISMKLYTTGSFCWRVRATDGTSPGTWSAISRFSRSWTPTISNLAFFNDSDGPMPRTAGSAASTTTQLTGYLQWDPVAGATSYDVEVAPQTVGFSPDSTELTRDGNKGTRVLLPHLPDSSYVWRVRAISATGAAGGWTYSPSPFTVAWTTMNSAPGAQYPAEGATTSDLRFGWAPTAGASYYQVQAASDPGCFWDPSSAHPPALWGGWVADGFVTPHAPSAAYCRLTEDGNATTINDWATWNLYDQDAMTGTVAGVINTTSGVCEVPGTNNTGAACAITIDQPTHIYWRVRPVSVISQSTESGWTVGGGSGSVTIYGKWLENATGGSVQPFDFVWDRSTVSATAAGTRCAGAQNPTTNGCLVQGATQLRADQTTQGSNSMQTPVLTWNAISTSQQGSYTLQVARDPNFDNIVRDTLIGGNVWTTSFSPTDGLPDNNTGGYWWRVIPCKFTVDANNVITGCANDYYQAAAGLFDGSRDQAGARSFSKQVTMTVNQSANFSNVSPLLSWTPVDSADHYDVEVASDPYFSTGDMTLETTDAAIVPTQPAAGNSGGAELGAGTWYWRVRAVDRNGLRSGWSQVDCSGGSPTGCFTERMTAPALTGPADGASTAWPVLTWNSVDSAQSYEVQVSSTSTFDVGTIKTDDTTGQTSDFANVPGGTWYWRVRALNGADNQGLWSAPESFSTSGNGTLSYGLPAAPVVAGTTLPINAQLTVDGAPTSGQIVTLLEKSATCGAAGTYAPAGTGTTGSSGLQGQINLLLKADQNRCFRVRWSSAGADHFSAPFQSSVVPSVTVLKWPTKRVTLATKKAFTPTVKFGKALSGKVTFQILIGKTWTTLLTKNVVRAASTKVSLKVPKAGNYQARATVTGTGVYADTTVSLPTIKVRDQFALKGVAAKKAIAKKAAAKKAAAKRG